MRFIQIQHDVFFFGVGYWSLILEICSGMNNADSGLLMEPLFQGPVEPWV